MKRGAAIAVLTLVLASMFGTTPASAESGNGGASSEPASTSYPPCTIGSAAGSRFGQRGVLINGQCVPAPTVTTHKRSGQRHPTVPPPVLKVVDCGRPRTHRADVHDEWNTAVCGKKEKACRRPGPDGKPVAVDAFATVQQDRATKKWTVQNVWCPGTSKPVPDLTTIYDQVLRLLPKVAVGEPPGKHETLVNIQTILWAQTAAHRDLGSVTIVGQRVQLRIGFDHAVWNFGDGADDTTTSPGRAYTSADHCDTAHCAGFYGHVYTATGTKTVSLQVWWRAEYSLDGMHWNPVGDAPIAGPTATAPLRVLQARGMLVPNPGE